jgi:hypothetical protein
MTDPNDDSEPTQEIAALEPRDELPEPILQFFTFSHLPETLQAISAPFAQLAHELVLRLPRNAERSVALRKLLECKDAAVRAAIAK